VDASNGSDGTNGFEILNVLPFVGQHARGHVVGWRFRLLIEDVPLRHYHQLSLHTHVNSKIAAERKSVTSSVFCHNCIYIGS